MATSTEIKDNNNTLIRVKTTAKSITKGNVADQLDSIVDYVDQENEKEYKELSLWMTISSGTITVEEIKNDFTGTIFSYSIPSAGRVQITASSGVLTADKVNLINNALGTASGGFFCRFVYVTSSFGYIYFTRWDNDTSTNPSVNRQKFEIRVYN